MAEKHKWHFLARFRRGGFGWKSQPAVKRVKEATSEIKKVARRHEILDRIRALMQTETFGERFVTKVLGRELRLR